MLSALAMGAREEEGRRVGGEGSVNRIIAVHKRFIYCTRSFIHGTIFSQSFRKCQQPFVKIKI